MKPLRFLHVPKTAGTTFNTILNYQYPGARRFMFSIDLDADIAAFNQLSATEQSAVTLFMGHAPLTTTLDRADSATIVTFLRDPVLRVRSFCQHVADGKSPYLLRDFPPESFRLDDFLESGNHELYNLQTSMLINRGDDGTPTILSDIPAPEALATATDNLFHKVSLFGLQEYFDHSLMIFAAALNWRTPYYLSRRRRNKRNRIVFEDRHLKRIVGLNAIDMELYRIARRHFEAMLDGPAFASERLWRFRLTNPPIAPVIIGGRAVWRRARRLIGRWLIRAH